MIARISRRNFCVEIPVIARDIQLRSMRSATSVAACWRAMRAAGGWSFAADPDRPAAFAPAIWCPRACAHVAVARPGPRGFAALRLADFVDKLEVAAELIGWRAWHLVLVAGGRRYRLAIFRCEANERLAFVNPTDAHLAMRAAGMMELHRHILGLKGQEPNLASSLGTSERWRLVQWLRLLDAAAQGASSREIAAALLLEDVARYSAAEWDASSERKRIARWRRAAIAMRDENFRTLLAAP